MAASSNSIGAMMVYGLGPTHSLTVFNENSQLQHFAMLQTLPPLAPLSLNPLVLAWLPRIVEPGSTENPPSAMFTWNASYSAVTGYVQDQGSVSHPRRFITRADTDVGVDAGDLISVTYVGQYPQGGPIIRASPTIGTPGVVMMQADNTIPSASQQNSIGATLSVGLAMDNSAAVAVQLLPNLTYQFTPKPSYYIIAGSFQQGEVIDTATIATAFQVPYDGVTDRTVTFTAQNRFLLSN